MLLGLNKGLHRPKVGFRVSLLPLSVRSKRQFLSLISIAA